MDRSAEMLVKDTGNPTNAGSPRGVGGSGGGGATTLPGAVGGGGATTLPGGGGGGGKFGFTDKQVTPFLLIALPLSSAKRFEPARPHHGVMLVAEFAHLPLLLFELLQGELLSLTLQQAKCMTCFELQGA